MKKREIYHKTLPILILVALLIVIQVVSSLTRQTEDITYKETSNMGYKVYLNKNDYYDTEYLDKGMTYVAALINYVDVDFEYNFNISEPITANYDYYIESDLQIYDKSNVNNIVFEKKEKLVEDTAQVEQNTTSVNISQDLKVDYKQYNALANSFKSTYNIPVDSRVLINLYVNINGIYERFDYPIKNSNNVGIEIPLTTQMLNINIQTNDVDKTQAIKATDSRYLDFAIQYINYLIIALLLIYIIKFILYFMQSRKYKTPYEQKIAKIMRDYDRVVVNVKHLELSRRSTDMIDVRSFENLIDVSDRLEKSILMMEVEIGKRCWFVVKNGDEFYRYILIGE